ncbi:MAG: dinitrogenase iron-molybdenum cofactor biosynthesis protein [Thermoplasmata archaeon]|nr:dinitrogenase iron-molybdenum cofactor biosynthesis protein [Thermoplasmata archaeon]
MRISVPSMGNNGLDEQVGEHFGRVPTYTIVDTETDAVETLTNTSEHMGGTGYPPELMAKANVDVMVCGGLGRRAIMMFEELGIRVFVGASGTVGNAVQMYQSGALQEATDENACKQHAFREHDHGEHDHHHG